MVTLCALAIAAAVPDAKADLKAVFERYKTLASYSATIECHDASGLYPGDYVVSLEWSGKNKFEVKVVEPTKPGPSAPMNVATAFKSDGSNVVRTNADGTTDSRPLNTDPNLMPSWEVECGLVLTALLASPSTNLLFSPQEGMKMDYSYGKITEWKGMKVKEIVLSFGMEDRLSKGSFYLTEDGKWLVGVAFEIGSQKGSYYYKDAKYGG